MIKYITVIILKKIIILVLCLITLSGCNKESVKNPIVTMDIKGYGEIKMVLYPKKAPNTVANFVSLINEGFYDGLTFHRLVPGFVLQGGDPNGDGTGGPGYQIKGEFKENHFSKNDISHTEKIVSMARSMNPDSAGSQFFIVLSDNASTSLDGKYAAFGKVTDGFDIIKKIETSAEVEDETTGKLKENIVITKVSVETFGKTYKVQKA